MNTPLVSICCVTYNHIHFLKECLEGFLIQKTNFPIEILIHDDASTDGTTELIREYEARYPELIKPVYQKENQFSKGKKITPILLKKARGNYIALCEGDDYWTDPLKLQKQVDFLEGNGEYAIIFTNGNVIYSDKSKKEHPIYKSDKNPEGYYNAFEIPEKTSDIYRLAKGNYIHTPGIMFRNTFQNNSLPEYMTDVSIGDWPLYMYLANTGKICFLNEFTFNYRVHQKGIYSNKTVLNKYQMTLGQFPGMIGFKGS